MNNHQLFQFLKKALIDQAPVLQVTQDTDQTFEVSGTREVMQGKKKVDGHFFASLVPKPKDVRLYFFPIYTHPDAFTGISQPIRKCLKGKSCFHLKNIDESLAQELEEMIQKGVVIYQNDQLI